jgi:hypothetical protein
MGGAGGCEPGTTRSCYTGPIDTEGVGICEAGLETCNQDGMTWGACEGDVTPGVEDCATGLDEDCNDEDVPCGGTHAWSKSFDTSQASTGHFVATDPSDNVVLFTRSSGSVDFGGGAVVFDNANPVAVKLDGAGNHLWSVAATGDNAAPRAVAVDASGNVVVAGTFNATMAFGGPTLSTTADDAMFVAKLDPDGNHLWSSAFGTTDDSFVWDVAVDGGGNVAITGYTNGAIDFGGGALAPQGTDDLVVAMLDPNGNHLWSKRLGDSAQQFGQAVAFDGDDDLLVAGYFYGSIDFGGGALDSAGSADVFVAKLDGSGNHVWSARYGASSDQNVFALATGPSDEVVVGGQFQGTFSFGGADLVSGGFYDGFVAKLDSQGNHVWSKRFGDAEGQFTRDVAVDASGNVWLTGYFQGTADIGGGGLTSMGDDDVLVAKLDAAGTHLHSDRFGDADDQVATALALDTAGAAFLAGYFVFIAKRAP